MDIITACPKEPETNLKSTEEIFSVSNAALIRHLCQSYINLIGCPVSAYSTTHGPLHIPFLLLTPLHEYFSLSAFSSLEWSLSLHVPPFAPCVLLHAMHLLIRKVLQIIYSIVAVVTHESNPPWKGLLKLVFPSEQHIDGTCPPPPPARVLSSLLRDKWRRCRLHSHPLG